MKSIQIGGAPKWRKEHSANTPGKDKRGQKPDFKAKVDTVQLKQSIMGRMKKK